MQMYSSKEQLDVNEVAFLGTWRGVQDSLDSLMETGECFTKVSRNESPLGRECPKIETKEISLLVCIPQFVCMVGYVRFE